MPTRKARTRWRTSRKSFRAALSKVKETLQRRSEWSIPMMGRYLGAVVRGHTAYFGVPTIGAFRLAVGWIWKRALERRSERTRVLWDRMSRLVDRWLPPARISHPYPAMRLSARTQGRSRMLATPASSRSTFEGSSLC